MSPMVTDYRGHRQTLLLSQKLISKHAHYIMLNQIIW